MRKLVKLIIILKNMKECNQGYLKKKFRYTYTDGGKCSEIAYR